MSHVTKVLLGVIILAGAVLAVQSFLPSEPAIAEQPRVRVRIIKAVYQNGLLDVVGEIENIGSVAIYSPGVELVVLDGEDSVLYTDMTWSGGCYQGYLPPGGSVTFESVVSVPGTPADVRYRVRLTNEDALYEIKYPGD